MLLAQYPIPSMDAIRHLLLLRAKYMITATQQHTTTQPRTIVNIVFIFHYPPFKL